jgi:hypothetical protein
MKMDSLMLSQFDKSPIYFNTIFVCCYLFSLELPLNMRRKDLRKTINMIDGETFVCHGSGDEEASCRHCNTAGNPGYD